MSTTQVHPQESSETPSGRSSNWYRGFIQGKTRIAMAWLFVALLAFTTRQFPTYPGIALCFAGAALRFWASGYLRKDNQLAVGGPYAYVRNPLYLGTYLMALGALWAIENWTLLGILSVFFVAVYHYIILDEEVKLRRIFQQRYDDYCSIVPRFFPIQPPDRKALNQVNSDTQQRQFSYALAMRNKAYEAFATFFALIALEVSLAYFWH